MRPVVKIATEGLEKALKSHLKLVLENGPLSERELLSAALSYFAPQKSAMTASLIRSYRLQYRRTIGKNTAEKNLTNNLRLLLSKLKKDILHTQKQVIIGRKRFGRIFYASGQEGKIAEKVRGIIMKEGGKQKEVLLGIKEGPVKITPVNKRAGELLEHYGLCEVRRIGKDKYAVVVGYKAVNFEAGSKESSFPKHFRVHKPFRIETWALQDGPVKINLKFDLAAWDPVHKTFYLGLEKDYVSLGDLKNLKEKQLTLGLPSKMVAFCKSVSEGAEKFAKKWGIEIRRHDSLNQ